MNNNGYICKKYSMRYYVLKTKDGEVINKVPSSDKESAKKIFALSKNLTVEALSKIYLVEEITN